MGYADYLRTGDKSVLEKKKKIKRKTVRKSSTTSKGNKKLRVKGKYKPEHFDGKYAAEFPFIGKVIQQLTFFTEEGIKSAFVTEIKNNKGETSYRARLYNVDYEVIDEQTFDDRKKAITYLRGWLSYSTELEDSGLLQCIKDVLTRINQVNSENYFLFRLLTDPDERKEYSEEVKNSKKGYTFTTSDETKSKRLNSGGKKLKDKLKNPELRKKISGYEAIKEKMRTKNEKKILDDLSTSV